MYLALLTQTVFTQEQQEIEKKSDSADAERDFIFPGFYPEILLPQTRRVGNFDLVTTFFGAMPTDVTVSDDNRVFVCSPRSMDDRPDITAVEVLGGGRTRA